MRRQAAWCLLWSLFSLTQAGASSASEKGMPLDFSLRFARATAPFDYGARSYDTASRWLGIAWHEQMSERIRLGMYGGYAYVTQTNNPLTAGVELDGYYAGLSWHGVVFAGPRASLFYAFDYIYQKVDHKRSAQTVVIDWSEPRAQLGATIAVTRRLRLYGGGNVGYIDGQERASGTVERTTNFSRASRTGGFLGIDFNVEPNGYVGIEGKTGLTRGGEIYFRHRF